MEQSVQNVEKCARRRVFNGIKVSEKGLEGKNAKENASENSTDCIFFKLKV
jgi:hypothetical protein